MHLILQQDGKCELPYPGDRHELGAHHIKDCDPSTTGGAGHHGGVQAPGRLPPLRVGILPQEATPNNSAVLITGSPDKQTCVNPSELGVMLNGTDK